MSFTRPPAVAGKFYPGRAADLRQMVNEFLETAVPTPADHPLKALIAPHAGYRFSGPIAGTAYAYLAQTGPDIRRVILLGPAHTMHIAGLAASSADAFATPLGDVPLDQESITAVTQLPHVHILDAAHIDEHGLEVHLPFLQTLFDDFELIPFVVGDTDDTAVAAVLEQLWGGPETLILISSDLSHFHDYDTACRLDEATAVAIDTLQPAKLAPGSACGRLPIRGLLHLAQKHHLTPRRLDLRNSGDTAGARHRVVGYGAWAFS